MIILDQAIRLSQSQIWQQQCDFYQREGINAWHNTVPFYATSNAFIADYYAKAIYVFMEDWHRRFGSRQFFILELGAGCGQFSYLCLERLQELTSGTQWHWRYMMSDFDEGLIHFWRSHIRFKPFIERNQLVFAQYKIGENTDQLANYLEESDAPLILIANYIFDSLPADIYQVGNERIYPVSITLATDDDNINSSGAVIDFDKVKLTGVPDTQELEYPDALLEQYRLELLHSHILYPTHALALLDALSRIASKGVFLVACDKAYVSSDELDYLECPQLTGHQGCFSLMVNFDLIRRHALLRSGDALLPAVRPGIKVGLFSFGFNLKMLPNLMTQWNQSLQSFTPADYLDVYRQMQKDIDRWTLETAVSFLALSQWDALVFERLYSCIIEKLDGADRLTIHYLIQNIPKIAKQYFWITLTNDLFFKIAVLFHTLQDYARALEYYERSLAYFSGVFGLYFNMGVCHYHLNQIELARHFFKKAEELDPEDPKIKEWLLKL